MLTEDYKKDINTYYDNFLAKSKDTLLDLLENRNMTGEEEASVISNVMVGAMTQSLQATVSKTQVMMNNEQIELEKRMKPFKLDSARIDTNIKEQKHFAEQLKNGGVGFTYTFYRSYFDNDNVKTETQLINETEIEVLIGQDDDNNDILKTFVLFRDYKRVAKKVINAGSGLSTAELQNLKIAEETNFIQTQAQQLIASVIYNNKIRGNDSLTELFGTLGAGGLVVPDVGWNAVFDVFKELTGSTISFKTFQKNVTKL
ncbi:MAG: hypothetical protein KAQ94_06020 [Arcobacteraceae bacterium]|nr:hypothetical protein [Arcobacteraceae bacterium]